MSLPITVSSSIRSAADLASYLDDRGISWAAAHLPTPEQLDERFPIRIPRHYADLIDWKDPNDPLRPLVLPDQPETPQPYELADPIGDHEKEVVPGLIHRYPDRALLLLTSYCLVHCRFCFRKEVVGKVRPVDFEAITEYLQQHPEITEIIFSGGDPLTFPLGFLATLGKQLTPIKHIKVWRFHTRVPAVDPRTITQAWMDTLATICHTHHIKPVMVIHINHPRELSAATKIWIKTALDKHILLLSQTVMLKNCNDDTEILSTLFKSLLSSGVKPYYLHHLDRAMGTHQFRISIEAGKKLYQSLRGNLSTIALPDYVLDLPGGYGKIPVMWLRQIDSTTYEAHTFEGKTITYVDYT